MDLTQKKLIILDRDGVINYDSDKFIKTPDEWIPIPSSLLAIKKLNDAGKIVTIASNQSGIARGLFSEATLHAIHTKMEKKLADNTAHLDALIYCPHGPNDHCACRKPLPGMLEQLLKQFNVTEKDAIVIGDSLRDLQAADAAGIDSILVRTGKGQRTLQQHKMDYPIYDDLLAVAEVICHE